MPVHVMASATLACSFGLAPGTLMVLPVHQTLGPAPLGNIGDAAPIANILPFGMCNSMANPAVAAATAAALGVLTPMPCVPVPAGTWLPGSPNVMLKSLPVLNNTSKAMCSWGGVIQVVSPGQFKVMTA